MNKIHSTDVNIAETSIIQTHFFFYIFMTYNLQRKIKFTITRYIKNVYTWEKNRNKKKRKKEKKELKVLKMTKKY